MPHRPDVSLRVFAAMALCVVIALATTLLAFDRFNRAELTAATARELQQLVELQRDQIEVLIDARVDETRLLAALPGVREDLQRQREASSDGAMANRLQRFTEHGNGLRLLAVVDPDSGRVLAASDARLLDISLSAHPLLHDSRNDAIVYGPQPSPLLQLHGLTVATPMRDSNGRLQAILVAAFDTSTLERMFADQAAWRPDTRLQLSAASESDCTDDSVAGPHASGTGEVIATRRWLPRHRLCLSAETDSEAVLAPADAAFRSALAAAALMLLLALGVGGWMRRDLRRERAAAAEAAAPVAARAEELERFADLAQELFATLSGDGRFLRINAVWPSELEYSLAQLDGQSFIDFVHPDDRDASAEALATLGNDRSQAAFENRFIDGSGDYRRIHWRAARGGAGTLCLGGMPVAAAADSDEIAAPEQVRQLRTALNGLFGALTLLRKTSLDPQQQLMLELAHSGGESLLSALPAAARSNSEPGSDAGAQASPDFTDTRVLVVEDDATSRQVTALMLSGLGCEVDTAENGAIALERIEATDYHLVFMDCEMPVMDGFAATAAIRAHEGERHLPVIAVTALSGRDERQRCFAAGMDDYLGKPVSERALAAALLRWRLRPVSALDAPETLDRSTLERLHATAQATSPAMLEQILAAFVDDSQQRIALMHTSIKHRDFDALRRAAHELKGASGVVGAQQMMRCCGRLQELAEQRNVDGAEPLLDRLEANFAEVREALTAWTS